MLKDLYGRQNRLYWSRHHAVRITEQKIFLFPILSLIKSNETQLYPLTAYLQSSEFKSIPPIPPLLSGTIKSIFFVCHFSYRYSYMYMQEKCYTQAAVHRLRHLRVCPFRTKLRHMRMETLRIFFCWFIF